MIDGNIPSCETCGQPRPSAIVAGWPVTDHSGAANEMIPDNGQSRRTGASTAAILNRNDAGVGLSPVGTDGAKPGVDHAALERAARALIAFAGNGEGSITLGSHGYHLAALKAALGVE